VPCVTLVCGIVWNALTGWLWAGFERWKGFVSLVCICGISVSKDHDRLYIVIVLNNGHTLMNLHSSFEFLPPLVLPMQHCACSMNSATHFVTFSVLL
jgi:hypothetical protein